MIDYHATVSKCDVCGLHDYDEDIVVVTDEEDGEDVTLCADCARDWDGCETGSGGDETAHYRGY